MQQWINRYIVGCKFELIDENGVSMIGINRYIVGCKLLLINSDIVGCKLQWVEFILFFRILELIDT